MEGYYQHKICHCVLCLHCRSLVHPQCILKLSYLQRDEHKSVRCARHPRGVEVVRWTRNFRISKQNTSQGGGPFSRNWTIVSKLESCFLSGVIASDESNDAYGHGTHYENREAFQN